MRESDWSSDVCSSDLLVSYALNLPSGAVIILLAGLAYALAAISKGIFDKRRQIRETTAQKNDLELIR
jgi:hypothetical protein